MSGAFFFTGLLSNICICLCVQHCIYFLYYSYIGVVFYLFFFTILLLLFSWRSHGMFGWLVVVHTAGITNSLFSNYEVALNFVRVYGKCTQWSHCNMHLPIDGIVFSAIVVVLFCENTTEPTNCKLTAELQLLDIWFWGVFSLKFLIEYHMKELLHWFITMSARLLVLLHI